MKFEALLGFTVEELSKMGCADSEAILKVREYIEEYAGEFVVQRESAKIIADRYFDGQEILFPDVTERLNQFCAIVGEFLRLYKQLDADSLSPLEWAAICKKWLPNAFARADRIQAASIECADEGTLQNFSWSYLN